MALFRVPFCYLYAHKNGHVATIVCSCQTCKCPNRWTCDRWDGCLL